MNKKVNFSWKYLKNISEALDSYKVRAFIDGKKDILNSNIYNEEEYYTILFKMIDEEKLKYKLYNYLKNIQDDGLSALHKFSDQNNIELKKLFSLLKLLEVEALVSVEEIYESNLLKNLDIKVFDTSIKELKSIYEPVQIIFDSNICSGCGACAGICPMDCITIQNGYGEVDDDKCIRCGLCYYVCPRSFLPVDLINMYQNDASEIKEYGEIGHYIEVYSARTRIEELKAVCQDGGISSTCLYFLLNQNKIDLALGAKTGEQPWCPEPTIIQSTEDIIKSAGTKYVNNPNLELLNQYNLNSNKKIAVVGVPCMMQALLKSEIYNINIPSLDMVKYRIGIFCMESFPYQDGFLKICEKLNVDVNAIEKTDINKGKFIIYTNKGEKLTVPIKEINNLAREDCEVCFDLTSESADISVGSIGAPSGWNCVVIRTSRGKELFEALIANDLIESKPIADVKPGLGLLKKIANIKKKNSQKHINKNKEKKNKIPLY